jgi:dolichol kinase
MTVQIIYTILLAACLWGVILFSELLYQRFKVNPEITRKIAHVLGTLSSISFVFLFDSYWYVLLMAVGFFALLIASKHKGIYKSIDQVGRKTMGSYLLPVSIFLMYFIYTLTNNQLYFIMPILILGISDPLAGLTGATLVKNARQISIFGYRLQKTWVGSLCFFVATFIITILTLYFYDYSSQNIIFAGLYFALFLTIIEMLSIRGSDNLTVPLTTALLLWIW